MSLSSTSSSKKAGWPRLRRDILCVVVALLALELVMRLDPVRLSLSQALDPYENLLWYSDYMPSYRDQLVHGPHYDVWMVGSSYMMTGLQPQWVQEQMAALAERLEQLSLDDVILSEQRDGGDLIGHVIEARRSG